MGRLSLHGARVVVAVSFLCSLFGCAADSTLPPETDFTASTANCIVDCLVVVWEQGPDDDAPLPEYQRSRRVVRTRSFVWDTRESAFDHAEDTCRPGSVVDGTLTCQ